jgi:hypothetical protein
VADLTGADIDKLFSSGTPDAPAVAAPVTPPAGVDIDKRFRDAAAAETEAAKAKAAAEPVTTLRGVARNAAAGLTDIGANVGNILSDPFANLVGRPLLTAGQFAYDALAPVFGYNRMSDDQRNALYADFGNQPGTRGVAAVGNVLGVAPGDVQAATPTEALVRKGVGAAGTMAALGPGGVGAPVMGATGAVAGDLATEAVPPWAKPGVEMAGNVAGALAGSKATSLGTKTANVISGNASTPLVDAYQRLGIDPVLLGDVTGNPTARLAQAYSSKSPGGAAVVNPVEQRVVGQFHDAVENTAQGLGRSVDAQGAGQVLQDAARNWKDVTFPAREDAAYQPVNQRMAGEQVDPAEYRASLSTLTSKLAALPETQKALLPPRIQTLLDAINKDAPPGTTISWQTAQDLRSAIGRMMGVPEIVQSVGRDQLKAAYGGIARDMGQAADTAGVGDAFRAANAVSVAGHSFIEGPLAKVISKNNAAQETIPAEKAAAAVLSGGDTTLQAMRQELPGATDELAGLKLRDMMRATPGAAGATGQETSVGSFLTNLNKLRQTAPNGTKALFSDPAVAQKLDDLATVADSMKETAKRANTSNTQPNLALMEMLGGLASGHYLSGGNLLATAGATMAPWAANKILGYGVTRPSVTNLLAAPGPRALPNPLAAGLLAAPDMRRLGQPDNGTPR